MTAASVMPGQAASAASISAGSMRKPRILTCSSARPRYSSCPSGVQRARSPVAYIRSPGGLYGQAMNLPAVSPGWFR